MGWESGDGKYFATAALCANLKLKAIRNESLLNKMIDDQIEIRHAFLQELRAYSLPDLISVLWDISHLQSDMRGKDTNHQTLLIKDYPIEVEKAREIGDPLYVPRWKLEHILNSRFAIAGKSLFTPSRHDPTAWSNFARLHNSASKYSDIKSAPSLNEKNIFGFLAGIGHQQLPFQSRAPLSPVYRAYKLCSGSITRSFFENLYDVELERFFESNLISYLACNISKYVHLDHLDDLASQMDFTPPSEVISRASISLLAASLRAKQLRRVDPLGEMQPSILRESPFIIEGKTIILPIPDLLPIALGENILLGYPKIPHEVFNCIANSFEQYVLDLLKEAFQEIEFKVEERYGTRQNSKNTPDLRLYSNGKLSCIIECKSQRIPFVKKFNRLNDEDFDPKISEVAKGVFQVWRYTRDIHQDTSLESDISHELTGFVATLENWHSLEAKLRSTVFEIANQRADREGIEARFRIPVALICAWELENDLWSMNYETFSRLPILNSEKGVQEWMPTAVWRRHESYEENYGENPLFQKLSKNLPRWDRMSEIRKRL